MNVPAAPISLYQVLQDQDDLDALCRERPLRTTEVFKPNDFYGNAAVVKRYAHVAPTRSLKGVLPHGVNLSPNWAWTEEITAPIPAIFFYPDYYRESYSRRTTKPLFPIASPFLYALAQVATTPAPDRVGSIFFAVHSTDHCTADYDQTSLSKHLAGLPAEMHPITVCLYYKDYLAGRATAFREKGFRVVTAGHMFDPLFLYRLAHLCRIHVFAISNLLGTHLFYAVAAGCVYRHLDHEPPTYKLLSDAPVPPPDTDRDRLHADILQFFQGPASSTYAAQQAFVAPFLSADKVVTPSLLRNLIEKVERLDWSTKVAALRLPFCRPIPYGYARPAIRAGRAMGSLFRSARRYLERSAYRAPEAIGVDGLSIEAGTQTPGVDSSACQTERAIG